MEASVHGRAGGTSLSDLMAASSQGPLHTPALHPRWHYVLTLQSLRSNGLSARVDPTEFMLPNS